jgi:SnoaL-like domain
MGLLRTEDQLNMSNSISTLLIRNLQEVFGENDRARRRAAVQELYTEDCVFYDPNKGVYRGREEINRIAGEIRATHQDFRYKPIAEPEEAGNGGRIRWVAAALVRRQLTPGPTSSLPRTAGLPPFISFSTSYPELNAAVLRYTDNERFVGKQQSENLGG